MQNDDLDNNDLEHLMLVTKWWFRLINYNDDLDKIIYS